MYSQQDNAERNQQLARIARAMAKLFPQWVVNTAAALAEVHALTERLDHAMARDYLALQPVSRSQSDAAPCMHAGGRWLTLLHASINSGLC